MRVRLPFSIFRGQEPKKYVPGVVKGHKLEMFLIDEWRDFSCCVCGEQQCDHLGNKHYGESPLLKIMKELAIFKLLKEANDLFYQSSCLPEDLLTRPNERAGPGDSDVEQQAEEEVVQMSKEEEMEPESEVGSL